MPTMSQDSVKMLPMYSRSDMTLEEIQEAMAGLPPKLDGFIGGWANMNNRDSNLRMAGLEPPRSEPQLVSESETLPEMLKARFYYWDLPPSGLKDHDPLITRRLNAVDIVVTQPNENSVGLLFSTRTRSYLGGANGAIASLNGILQSADATIKIDRNQSHLELFNEEIFLWLAVQNRDEPQLSSTIILDEISGISSRDVASRTAELRSGVDFERANFLTAVAENDTLGPIDVCFVNHVDSENHSYEVRVHIDGGFEVRKHGIHYPDAVMGEETMMNACLHLAFSLIPMINKLYIADMDNWKTHRERVIRDSMSALEERYRSLKEILESRLAATP